VTTGTTGTPVRPLTGRQQRLKALGEELTPAKSLARMDAATARVVATVSIVGTLLTGLGLVTAGLPDVEGAARVLAACSAVLAVLAVLFALSAQIFTVTRGVSTDNLKAVEKWYRRYFGVRGPLTSAASVLLVLAAAAAGAAATLVMTGDEGDAASFAVTRTAELPEPSASATPTGADTLTVDVTFRNLDDGHVATVTVSVDGRVVAQTAITPAGDGTASRSLTVAHVPATATVRVSAAAGDVTCTADGSPGQPLALKCVQP
jgi:hypothetical protein